MAQNDAQGFNCCRCISYFEEMNPERRKTMEDTVRIVDGFMGRKENGFFAVYDGHGGRDVSLYLQEKLHDNMAEELSMKDDRTMEQRIESAYLITDLECCRTCPTSVGSTAVTAMLLHDDDQKMLYSSNVGDSRAVLCHNRSAVRLSVDHKAEDPDEEARINKHGGFVLEQRVAGVLAVARSFGDFEIKQFVPAKPTTTVTRLGSPREHPFLILACDGVWDVISDQESVDMVLGLSSHQQPQAAEMIVKEAMKRESCDNITCVVVFFD